MATIRLPMTTYLVRSAYQTRKLGSPSRFYLRTSQSYGLAKVSFDKLPTNAVITGAFVEVYSSFANTGSYTVQVFPLTQDFKSSVTWKGRPSNGSMINSQTRTDPAKGSMWTIDVTTWAATRPKLGLLLSAPATHWINGSAAGAGRPVLRVEYYVPGAQPSSLSPAGGAVSVQKPVLTYSMTPDSQEQKVDFSTDGGATVTSTTGWIPVSPGSKGRMAPAELASGPAAQVPAAALDGTPLLWRVSTRSGLATSAASAWAEYYYAALPTATLVSPGATTADGSPPVVWTVDTGTQAAARVSFRSAGTLVDQTDGWLGAAERDWTPGKAIKVPGGVGSISLEIKDGVLRVPVENGPVSRTITQEITTTLTGSGTAPDNIVLTVEEPLVRLTGTRAQGIPDEIGLFRDGVQVPIWTPDGYFAQWAPGPDVFEPDLTFELVDYTAAGRHKPVWTVRTRTNGSVSSASSAKTAELNFRGAWLVNPETGEKVEFLGEGGKPVVSQSTDENAVLHTPVNGGPIVEQTRRRLVRTTKSGSITGIVLSTNNQEEILEGWAEGDSSQVYRLIFGKVNWPVILGDYNPVEITYDQNRGPDRIQVSLNWWQRLRNS